MPDVFRASTATRFLRQIYCQVKMPQNGRNKVFRHKQTRSKVPLIFLDVKMPKEKEQQRF